MAEFTLDFPYAYGKPNLSGYLRTEDADFVVREMMPENFFQTGEHVCVQIEKTGQNTAFVARRLANFAGVREMDVGYCGLKDRHAITTQWFSVYFGKRPQPDWQRWSLDGTKILQRTTHKSKLRRGDHLGNEFEIVIRKIGSGRAGEMDLVRTEIEARLCKLERFGAPNYFGEQRFGHNFHNLQVASQWFKGEKRMKVSAGAMYISAARAYLFNNLLADRVEEGKWNTVIGGDLTTENGEALGSLFGDGTFPESDQAMQRITQVTDAHPLLAAGLRDNRIRIQHRPFVLQPKRLKWHWENDNLCVSFCLPVGAFATTLLREAIDYTDLKRDQDIK